MPGIFTPEDTVVLKEDPSITAIVEQSWRDIDSVAGLTVREWIPHNGVQEEDVKKAYNDDQLPKGLVVIRLCDPWQGCAVIKESDLVLKDRGLVTGDVVKRAAGDAESGYVVKTHLECLCQPIYAGIPFHGSQKWDYKPEENEIRVPAEELTFPDLEEGKYVIYQGWVGEITWVWNQVTVRLSNGSIVRVKKPEDLVTPSHGLHTNNSRDYRNAPKSLAKTLKDEYRRMEQHGPATSNEPEVLYPGQRLSTTKSNLRLGEWVVGSYTPSIAPNVTVVDVRPLSIDVTWLTFNIFSPRPPAPPPPTSLDGHELEELTIYNKNNVSSQGSSSNDLGSRRCQGVIVGEHVAFRDPAGAAVKYADSAPRKKETGVFRRIPRNLTEGFEMNTFYVRETKQRVRVQWQNGSLTDETSTGLVPYLNVDENDLWPGEICSLKTAETRNDGMIQLNRLGVVQSVNAQERVAKVRWFVNSKVAIFEENLAMMEPGSNLGRLSNEISEVSVYEVVAYSAVTRRRGDLVLVSPNEDVLAVQQASALDATAIIDGLGTRTRGVARSGITPESIRRDPQGINTESEIRYFGEVVDLGLDGLLTVRLGALKQVEDIRVSITRVFVVIGGDDDEEFPFDGPDPDLLYSDYSDFSDEFFSDSSENVIDETIEYEGGERLDNDGEDAWMTDEDEDDDNGADIDEKTMNSPRKDGSGSAESAGPHSMTKELNGKPSERPPQAEAAGDTEMRDADDAVKAVESSQLLNQSDYDFSKFSGRPEGFEILDAEPSKDHHFATRQTHLSAPLLRRIRKEHKILESSLPDGIWVRTWAERLDILRILILGPRATPYELAPFVLDVQFREDFPNSPPHVYFHSWTNGVGRINPNLYEDGKVCLSILGTWPGNEGNEGWNRDKSSLLQVLVSLMGLVLVEEPYYNEAGFESLVGTEDTRFASQTYSEKAYCMAKGFVEHALRHPVQGIDTILQWLYVATDGPQLLALVVKETKEALLRGKEGDSATLDAPKSSGVTKRSSMRLSTGAEILIKRFLPGLEKRLAEL